MTQQNQLKGATALVMYYDDFSRSYKLKAPYVAALWVIGAGLVIAWIAAVW